MDKLDNGVFGFEVYKDLDKVKYQYEIYHQNIMFRTIDPYSYSSSKNAEHSIVVDRDKFIKEKNDLKDKINSYADAIIYELSVRDFTMDESSGVINKGKLLGLIEDKTSILGCPTAFNYLKRLGITHVQLMPVFDFDSYDEDDYLNEYNWGYDPKQYNVVEGSYLVNDCPYNRINDLRNVVNKMHENNIRVNLDVVFNHVGNQKEYAWEKLVPYYAFRYESDERLSNGSFCGNEIRSEAKMMRKYIVDMCKRYVDIFDIDGLRFDLMGLIDIETMNMVYQQCSLKKKDFMVYGEGWDMPSVLSSENRTINYNNYQTPSIAYFNDIYRDTIKGATALDMLSDIGYALGDMNKKHAAIDLIAGSSLNGHFLNNTQSINYVECHDNMTFKDKINNCLLDNDDFTKTQKTKLTLAIVMLSQGIPFIHSGQEFMRSKHGYDNTYNIGDEINAINWYESIRKHDLVRYFKDLILMRKRYPELRLFSKEQLMNNISFEDYYEILVYKTGKLKILINPASFTHEYPLNNYCVIFNDKFVNDNKNITATVNPFSLVVLEEL